MIMKSSLEWLFTQSGNHIINIYLNSLKQSRNFMLLCGRRKNLLGVNGVSAVLQNPPCL